jgi:predicted NAD/FAD-dependent oxidoreductase
VDCGFFWLIANSFKENLFCAGSYRDILALIAKPAVKNAEIKLETKADQISYRTRSQEPVKIHVNSGETYQFDEVVVTSPLGWLQKNLHTFDPALPTELAKSIKSVAWGVLEKVQ